MHEIGFQNSRSNNINNPLQETFKETISHKTLHQTTETLHLDIGLFALSVFYQAFTGN